MIMDKLLFVLVALATYGLLTVMLIRLGKACKEIA